MIQTHWFTSDEHYSHINILNYFNRPFSSVEEMDNELIRRHNEKVSKDDITVHCGDFTLKKYGIEKIVNQLNGLHIFLRGSHDHWMSNFVWTDKCKYGGEIWEKKIGNNYIVCSHYCMRVWPRSHYGSIQIYGHSHGNLPPIGKQLDVGVDCCNYPISINEVIEKTEKGVIDDFKRRI